MLVFWTTARLLRTWLLLSMPVEIPSAQSSPVTSSMPRNNKTTNTYGGNFIGNKIKSILTLSHGYQGNFPSGWHPQLKLCTSSFEFAARSNRLMQPTTRLSSDRLSGRTIQTRWPKILDGEVHFCWFVRSRKLTYLKQQLTSVKSWQKVKSYLKKWKLT